MVPLILGNPHLGSGLRVSGGLCRLDLSCGSLTPLGLNGSFPKLGVPYCSILGSILGSPDFGKLPNGRLSESGPSFCAHENTAPPRYSDYRRNSPPF